MSEPLDILLCEPDDAEAASLVRHLTTHGLACNVAVMHGIEEASAALPSRSWDIVLAAHRFPEYDARPLLDLIRSLIPDLPFIALADEGHETSSTALIVAGARDVIVKTHLSRLIPVILRELETARLRENLTQAAGRAQLHFRNIVDSSLQGIMVRANSKTQFVNPAFCKMFGYSREEMMGLRSITELHLPEERARLESNIQHRYDGNLSAHEYEVEGVRKDGSIFWCSKMASHVEWDGQPAVQIVVVDITERKKAEIEIARREALFRNLAENSIQGILIVNHSGKPLYVNSIFAATFGYAPEEISAMNEGFGLFHPDEQPKLRARMVARRAGDASSTRYECRGIKKDGTPFWIELLAASIEWNGERAVQVAAIDISEQKKSAQLLEAREKKYRETFENAPVAMFRVSRNRTVLDANLAFEMLIGYSREELAPRTGFSLIHPDDAETMRRHTALIWEGKVEYANNEYRMIRKDGTQIWVSSRGRLTPDENGELNHLIVQLQDITDRKIAEADLQEAQLRLAQSERQYRELFESAPVAMGAISLDGNFLRTNQAFRDMIGYSEEELRDLRPEDTVVESQRESVRIGIASAGKKTNSGRTSQDLQLLRKDGQTIWAWMSGVLIHDSDGKPSYILSHLQDITARKKAEEQLFQSQKMEALGNLAGGIAHDFNNMLLPIIGLSDLSKGELPPDHPVQENLDTIIEAAEKARQIVRQILTFSRQGQSATRPVVLSDCFAEAIELLRNVLPATIRIVDKIAPDVGVAKADAAQLHSVLLNLGSNSAQALNGKVGEIVVELTRATVGTDLARALPKLIENKTYARLSVADNGCGMPKDMVDKIFNPFFTTKPVGEGTGLGLSMVHGIVESFGGEILVTSEEGKGTRFDIYLPLLSSPSLAKYSGEKRKNVLA